jgi:hypothetical protein
MFDRISRELRRLAAFKWRVYVYSATSLSARRISRSSAGVTVAELRKTGGNAPNNERANFLGWFLSVLLSGVTACDYNPDRERDYYPFLLEPVFEEVPMPVFRIRLDLA